MQHILRSMSQAGLVLCWCLLGAAQTVAGGFFEQNGLAIDGYDPVAYVTDQQPVKGLPEFRVEHQGATFQFASVAHREMFVANPDRFIPQYGGYCAYGMAKGYKAKIDPVAFSVIHGKLYLNYSEDVRIRWLSDVPGYIQQANANWPTVQMQTKVRE